MKVKKVIVNLDGWYCAGLGALPKGRVLDLEKLKAKHPQQVERIMTALENEEEGFCRIQKEKVVAITRKIEEADIMDETISAMRDILPDGDSITQDEIEEFKKELQAKINNPPKSKLKKDKTSKEKKKKKKKKIEE